MNKNSILQIFIPLLCMLLKWLIISFIFCYITQTFSIETSYLDGEDISGFIKDKVDNQGVKSEDIGDSSTFLLKYRDIIKIKIAWFLKGKGSKEYSSYKDFKMNWNPKEGLMSEFKLSLKKALKDPGADFVKTRLDTRDRLYKSKINDSIWCKAKMELDKKQLLDKLARWNNMNNK